MGERKIGTADLYCNGQLIQKAVKYDVALGEGKTFTIDSIPLLTEAEIKVEITPEIAQLLKEDFQSMEILNTKSNYIEDSKIEKIKKSRRGHKKNKFWE